MRVRDRRLSSLIAHRIDRKLIDYLENVDISTPDALTIHRVAVVHPLDESRVTTCTKGEFFRRVREVQGQESQSGRRDRATEQDGV